MTVAPLLEVRGLRAGYGQINVLHDIDLEVGNGEVVVVLGANGAGKSTLMSAISGLIPHTGTILIDGAPAGNPRPDQMLKHGLSLVPQGRGTLTALDVIDNLRVGGTNLSGKKQVDEEIDRWFEIFPRLKERSKQVAGTLSGGEQQMLAIARALMSRPRMLMCDEISLGLAPLIIQELFETLGRISTEMGTALLLVEQNAELALDIASRVYLLEVGAVASSGSAASFRDNNNIRQAYLGY
ncbi:ABC transporter ATP-binding protein [Aeromicrobium wangtongii]|uniref:ABC transporter ATP-binding protein n=1 Tax=Aeromicrobium wangtongii TaxID=2969247 RepID=A0ABY5M6N2_9ACTN|nr:ABC transporter ATP-binding protein [Aeromicrobium wangtongii]MCD9199858.1 ABC transporter ATP-binding protein [Aeromicrobium wangtongii]UUP13477.1 ABC transporter ATP-binding protein [Aeromicrobium wangtongii]